jgi:hypothetical protein
MFFPSSGVRVLDYSLGNTWCGLSLKGPRVRDWRDKAVATPWQGFNVLGMVRRVTQDLPKLANRCVQAIVKIDERVVRPQLVTQFVTADHFSGTLQEQGEDLKGLGLKSDLLPVLEEFAGPQIDHEVLEARHVRGGRGDHADA